METKRSMALPVDTRSQWRSATEISLEQNLSRLDIWWAKVCLPLVILSLGSFLATILAFTYFPSYVGRQVFGSVNIAYLLALSQFGITFLVAVAYSISAGRTADPLRDSIRSELEARAGGNHD